MNLSIEEIQNTIAALTGYNYFLLQVSKSKICTRKERQNAKDDINVINNLLIKYKKILEELGNEN